MKKSKAAWGKQTPHNIYHALSLCEEFGLQHSNMGRQRLCDHFGNETSTTGKWIAQATFPVKRIMLFEQLCGAHYVTQYLANSQGFMLVPTPTGHGAKHKDLTAMQVFMTEVAGLLIRSYDGRANAQQTIDAIAVLMKDLAFHQKNVAKMESPQPELSLVNDDE